MLPLLVLLLCLADTSIAATPGAAAPVTRLNATQAVQAARAFCDRIGQPVPTSVSGTASFAVDALGPPGHYWQPIWDVTFPGKAEVEVADATGIITDYHNDAYYITHRDNSPAGEALPQQEAILRAKEALDATGQREPLLFWQASLDHYSDPPLANTSIWSVRWYRAAEGVPYRGQHASLSLDAQTGEVEGLVLMFGSAPLASAVRALRQEDAINVAAAEVIRQGIEQGATHKETHLEIVTPDSRWPHSSDKPGKPNGVRLAWVTTFIVDDHWRQVDVDTETGEVLGGNRDSGPAGRNAAAAPAAAPALPTLGSMLSSVRAVYVRGRDAKGGWAAKPLLKFNAKSQPQAVALLTKTTDFRKEGPSGVAPQQIVLVSKSHAIGVYSCFPETGLLGGGSDWAAVPDGFKTWVQRKIAAKPSPTPGPRR